MITPSFGLTATERVLPKLALDFTTASLDSRITFTRTTGASNPATYVNSSGVITAATNNQPRFDYDPVTLACKGLLIEESRSNSFLYSEQFNNSAWTKSNTTITQDAVVAPDGNTTADLFYEQANTGTHIAYQNVSLTSGTTYTASYFVKYAGRYFQIYGGTGSFGSNAYATFDLQAGTIGPVGSAATATITPFGNGWYRCTLTAPAIATTNGGLTPALSNNINGGRTPSYTGDGSSGAYIWGAQLEAGAFATSYIPTTSAALTRNADVAVMTGTNFSDWFNASEGTFTVQTVPMDANAAAYRRVLAMSDGTSNNRMLLYKYSSYGFEVDVGGATTANVVKGAAVAGATFHVAAAYKTNSVNFANNTQLGTEDTSCTIPSGVNELSIGSNLGTSSYLNGWIGKIAYYNQRLTNSELQAFSK